MQVNNNYRVIFRKYLDCCKLLGSKVDNKNFLSIYIEYWKPYTNAYNGCPFTTNVSRKFCFYFSSIRVHLNFV